MNNFYSHESHGTTPEMEGINNGGISDTSVKVVENLENDTPALVFSGRTIDGDQFVVPIDVALLRELKTRREIEILVSGAIFSHDYALHDGQEEFIIDTCAAFNKLNDSF